MESNKFNNFNQLTEIQIKNILSIIDNGLSKGLGEAEPGKMCVEAAVCYGLGLPHSDRPICVGNAVRSFKINLNDLPWSSKQVRAQGLRKLAIAQLGSDQINQLEFSKLIIIETIKKFIPIILEKVNLLKEAEMCRNVNNIEEANETIKIAYSAYSATRDYSDYNISCYIEEVINITYYARDASNIANTHTAADLCATHASALCATHASALSVICAKYSSYSDIDKFLNLSAEIALDVLIKLESPGCKFLYLCD